MSEVVTVTNFLRRLLPLVTLVLGCEVAQRPSGDVLSPQPIPAGLGPQFDVARIELTRANGATEVRGLPSALSGGPGRLWAFNADEGSRAEAPFGADGAFVVRVSGSPSAHYRLVGLSEDALGIVDVRGSEPGGPAEIRSIEVCLEATLLTTLARAESVPVGSSATMRAELTNACDRDVVVSVASISGDAFTLGASPVGVLRPGAGQVHEIRFTPVTAGTQVGALVLDLSGSRVVVTVVGHGTN